MDASLYRLWELATEARELASSRFGVDLTPDDWDAFEDLLQRAGDRCEAGDVESLAAMFGAWFGAWAVSQLDGEWVGLFEPVAPRVDVSGLVFSPIDAVRRRLWKQSHAPTISEIVSRIVAWKEQSVVDRCAETYRSINRQAWDELECDPRFSADHFDPLLSFDVNAPIDPWLEGAIAGRDVLCLAAGGGLHGPLLASAGARVTVVDLSPKQLRHDERLAIQYRLTLRTLERSIDDLHGVNDSSFDVVVQPVSSCYVSDLKPMFAEVARVLRRGGLYVSQHKQPMSLQAGAGHPYTTVYPAIEGGRLSEVESEMSTHREAGTVEFLHTWTAILGGLCRSGFAIEDVDEPVRADVFAAEGTPQHRASFLPPYVKVKARRLE